ncbi:riboflavin synthase [Pseudoneobacillus rhizosphaerae]|uniref:Riboflavin synthase n=1 Tax=Pseudoneobacillus rhizosphaerae TaxID=2880968 RepID=A0A9C7LCM3_9BACI|nr:riboflavin synthase [Pseudoneobacillus rhizosphaerae]CAG9609825.1 Riboflavin synthase [Pseudoneobacillus rhizosphaerae]
MFTGIIEEIGSISNIKQTGESIIMTIDAKKILKDVQLGDSIAVNGVCLTVTSFSEKQFTVDVMPETVKATSLRALKRGSKVNLERAMAAGGRFGGHFVSGHADGLGVIKSKKPVDNAVYYEIEVSNDILQFIIYKGSITVDGTSLTVFGLSENSFTISLIPHTTSETIIGLKGTGDIVNIECDMLGKYIDHFLSKRFNGSPNRKTTITSQFLEENGFK